MPQGSRISGVGNEKVLHFSVEKSDISDSAAFGLGST